ncbi:hypothetical protein BOO71_0012043 [Deinococcus marmoris]|uniref:Uncharacterized protein n=1 Tax=Deinococcus marmoris TaxID=249408 RepID=A0A1U7NTX4_9DEIO|nr:hypothetical protein BOO71_0012043 [Deinococcus marmoris]
MKTALRASLMRGLHSEIQSIPQQTLSDHSFQRRTLIDDL